MLLQLAHGKNTLEDQQERPANSTGPSWTAPNGCSRSFRGTSRLVKDEFFPVLQPEESTNFSKGSYEPGPINSHYFHIIGDGHRPNSRGLYTHYKDSY